MRTFAAGSTIFEYFLKMHRFGEFTISVRSEAWGAGWILPRQGPPDRDRNSAC